MEIVSESVVTIYVSSAVFWKYVRPLNSVHILL